METSLSEFNVAIFGVTSATENLRQQLHYTSIKQATNMKQVMEKSLKFLMHIKNLAVSKNYEQLQEAFGQFHECIDHVVEVSEINILNIIQLI